MSLFLDASSDSAVIIQQAQFSWSLAGDQEHPTDHPSHEVSSAQSSAEDEHINSVANARSSTQKLININLNIPKVRNIKVLCSKCKLQCKAILFDV